MAVLKHSPSAIDLVYSDLINGLSQNPKQIPSKYFYDAEGSRLFERITELKDYYPTRCEAEILRTQSRDILISAGLTEKLNIVEIGAGDGRKTKYLLNEALDLVDEVTYRPVDISEQALNDLALNFSKLSSSLKIEPMVLDLDHEMHRLPLADANGSKNLVMYLGSSLGNFLPNQQVAFLKQLNNRMGTGDLLLTGFDLKKDSEVLRKAYDDHEGVTSEFNFNLFKRFNRELGADFSPARFKHQAAYNPSTGAMESWLVSTEDQTVHLPELDIEIRLEAYEGIHVETSWKFSPREIRNLAHRSQFSRIASFYDPRGWFVDELWMA